MKRILTAAALVLGIIATTAACDSPTTPLIATAASPSTTTVTTELSSEWGAIGFTSTPESARNLARAMCRAFDADATFFDLTETVMTAGVDVTPYQAGYVIGSSVRAYCPQYADRIATR